MYARFTVPVCQMGSGQSVGPAAGTSTVMSYAVGIVAVAANWSPGVSAVSPTAPSRARVRRHSRLKSNRMTVEMQMTTSADTPTSGYAANGKRIMTIVTAKFRCPVVISQACLVPASLSLRM